MRKKNLKLTIRNLLFVDHDLIYCYYYFFNAQGISDTEGVLLLLLLLKLTTIDRRAESSKQHKFRVEMTAQSNILMYLSKKIGI